MYQYDAHDREMIRERTAQFRDQVERRISGALTEEEFKPLRLMNGLYLQLHAYMLRVAIPYGVLSANQMRTLADIAEKYDRGYGHFTTRQNIQYNWPKLGDVPAILDDLGAVEMHAIQTSGNCIRNVTTDVFAGVAADEAGDPRPVAEAIRQWSTFHPEFTFLPRKFKIAIAGSRADRAATKLHDIGLIMVRDANGVVGCEVSAGGGQGRTPMIGKVIRDFIALADLPPYLEAIMRVYNLYGRRDNKYKARIKILVHELGVDAFKEAVEAEYARIDNASVAIADAEWTRIASFFSPPAYEDLADEDLGALATQVDDGRFARWLTHNVEAHQRPGYAAAVASLKPIGGVPGDATDEQMRILADLADEFSFGELRVSHAQNIGFPNVPQHRLPALWARLEAAGLGEANHGLATDIICCPGLDYCALATARSIPVAQAISNKFSDPARQATIGPLPIKISGCINACGHHHVGAIGVLGLEKNGVENYQITLGGQADGAGAVGQVVGAGLAAAEVPEAIDRVVDRYLDVREDGETFIDTYRRVGRDAFKEVIYAAA
ncbi:MAG: nitrite/sulfite reductase [Pseudomonadota bacterium]